MCDVHTYNNDDEILQDLLETNIRQRGDVGGSAKKIGMRIKELERIYGIKVGNPNYEKISQLETQSDRCEGKSHAKTQSDLASDMGMDVRTLQNYKTLADMIPELEELVDTKIVTKTTALAMMRNLSEEEQEELISSLQSRKSPSLKSTDLFMKNRLKRISQRQESNMGMAEQSLRKIYHKL